jgi:hypothetical protein
LINQVERWFAQLSRKQIKRGNHHSVQQLQEAIETFVKEHNASPKPFGGSSPPIRFLPLFLISRLFDPLFEGNQGH